MGWVCSLDGIHEMRIIILVGNLLENGHLVDREDDNIKMDLREVSCEYET
jgi:hypothetical protein